MRRSIFLLASFLLIGNISFAQDSRFGVPNLIAYDKERFHWGFSLGINVVDVNLKTRTNYEHPAPGISPNNPVMEIYSEATPAFNVGIVANMRLGEYFDLRFIPSFSIAHNIRLFYRFDDDIATYYPLPEAGRPPYTVLREIECHYINFPLFFKFKSSRMHNVRMYAIAGGQIGVNMISGKNNKIPIPDPNGVYAEIMPIIKPYDVQVKGGVGFDFYTTYFKFSTEFKVSFGVINMLEKEEKFNDQANINFYKNSPIIQGLQSLKSKTFSISLIIE